MTDFTDFNTILDILVSYFTGTQAILALIICFMFFLIFLVKGVDFRYASLFVLPLVGFFVAIGFFGDVSKAQWIVNGVLIVISFFYGLAILRFMS